MKTTYRHITLTILTFWGLTAYAQKQTTETRNDFKKYYDQFKVDGSFILYDQNKDKYIVYNQPQTKEQFTPSSTYKICNSLIGLETGVIKDENFVIKWDSVTRQNPNWNKDHDLKAAFRNSTVWYYQENARRVGGVRMKYWLDKANYGNADTSGGIDKFWLTGGLRITPEQEIDFLKRLYNNKLPFSQRTMDIVKKIMVFEQTPFYTISSKTGWGGQDNKDIGWYVGYIETKGNVYYFANCIQTTDFNNNDFARARIDITNQILADLKLTTNENLKISHLTGDYYIFTTYEPINGKPFPSNGMYCVTYNGVVLFDTPWDTTQFQPLLDSIANRHNKKVVACIATHFHEDRTAGLEYFKSKGIKTYSSKQTFDLCKQHNEKQAEFYFINDTTFNFVNHSFQTFYAGEGHTKDNIVLWCNDAKILYGGCLVKSTENKGLGNIADANLNEWSATIKNIIKKYPKPTYVIPGHFDWTSNQGLEHTLKLLRQK